MNSWSAAAVSKITVIFFLFYFSESDAGCKLYGHSCWGGHGKRSSSHRHFYIPFIPEKGTSEWYFSKVMKLSGGKPEYSLSLQKQDLNDLNKYNEFGDDKNFPIELKNDYINSNYHFPISHRDIKEGRIKKYDRPESDPFDEILNYK